MKTLSLRMGRAGALALSSCFSLIAQAQPTGTEPALQDVIIVTGVRTDSATDAILSPDALPFEGADLTQTLIRTPGAARVGNGELSGQVQYRGLFGDRLNLRVDGQRFASGGPNLMDPVFHYAPPSLVESVIVDRGVSPVSAGPGLAGGADAVFKRINYADSTSPVLGYDLVAGGRSVNDNVSLGAIIGASTQTWRFNLLGSWEEGDETDFGDGVIAGSAFERGVYGMSAGARTAIGTFSLDLRRQNTGPSGNPPFPMDIQYFDTDFARLSYAVTVQGIDINAGLHVTDVAHLMDNFSQRPAPAAMAQRATFADATTWGGDVSAGFDLWGGAMLIGLDGEQIEHDVTITNPNNADFFVTPFPQIELSRFGGFAEWTGSLGPIEGELGVRLDHNAYDASTADLGAALPMGPRGLAAAFNTAERSGDDATVDAVARLWTPQQNGMSYRLTLARKQRMPGYIQRYGWLPINASGGLADGNIYVGDLALEPETATILEGGFDYRSSAAYLRPTLFVRRIDDYIQGVPLDNSPGVLNTPQEMIAGMNGDPTPLIWANVDAQLVGFDLDAGFDFEGPLRVDAVANYVQGERRDISDNLYRIAPPSLTAALSWDASDWTASLELRAVDGQDDVSVTNDEPASNAYALVNLYGTWQINQTLAVSGGIENLFDEVYRDHLSGVNRNGFGDVGLGERVPGAGRGVFLRLSVKSR